MRNANDNTLINSFEVSKGIGNNDIAGEISGHISFIPDYYSYRVLLNALGLEN